MKRIKSIDIIRGISMWIMVAGHIGIWWLREEDNWLRDWLYAFIEPIGSTGFIFASGISTALALNSNKLKMQSTEEFSMNMARNVYFFRAIMIIIIGFIYNIIVLLVWGRNITDIWSWLILQTIGFSLILYWPLAKTSKYFKILLGIFMIFINKLILDILFPYQEQPNLMGVLYHLLFNPISQYVILAYFGIFMIGAFLGDIIFKINILEDNEMRKLLFKKKVFIYSLIIGAITLVFGIFYFFPRFLYHGTISSISYSLGIILVIFSILIRIEAVDKLKAKKSYRFLFFYSYYSFTIYLTHYALYFVLLNKLNIYTLWVPMILTTILLGLLLRVVYKKFGPKASLKSIISLFSYILAKKIEKRNQI